MKRYFKLLVVTILFFFLIIGESFSQRRFKEHGEEHGLKIEQRWRRSKIFDSTSDAMLVLKITNNNEYAVEVKITVGFYNGGILSFVSEKQDVCFMPGQTKKGGRSDLRFIAKEITLADTRADDFSWDFAKIEVVRVEKCDK